MNEPVGKERLARGSCGGIRTVSPNLGGEKKKSDAHSRLEQSPLVSRVFRRWLARHDEVRKVHVMREPSNVATSVGMTL